MALLDVFFAVTGILNLPLGVYLVFRYKFNNSSDNETDLSFGTGSICFGLFMVDEYTLPLLNYNGTLLQQDVLPTIGLAIFVYFLYVCYRSSKS